MSKKIIGLLVGLVGMTTLCFAGDISFGEVKTAVSGADAQEFEVKDVDGDSKPDLIWRDSSGDLKYSLQSSDIPTNGLVAYYPFNGNANDESGNGNDGVGRWKDMPSTPRCRNRVNSLYFPTYIFLVLGGSQYIAQ